MAYKQSKGEREFGDIEYENDGDTKINFEQDQVKIETGGAERLTVQNSGALITGSLEITGSGQSLIVLNTRDADNLKEIVFNKDGSAAAAIQINSGEHLFIENENAKDIILRANNQNTIRVYGSSQRVGINQPLGSTSADAELEVNGTLLLSSSANQELIRIAKAEGNVREITFENEGTDIGSIYFNAAEHMFIRQEDAAKDLSLRLGTTNAVRCDGSTSRVGIYTDSPAATLDVNGTATFSGSVSFPDVLLSELSIPGIDLQTDVNAYRFNCPYDMTVTALALALDQHSTSGNVTVTVTNTTTGNTMITLSVTGTNLSAATTNVSNASAGQGDVITFAITATPANAQSLRASLEFRRDL